MGLGLGVYFDLKVMDIVLVTIWRIQNQQWLKVATKATKSKTNSCPFLQKEISTQEQYCSTWSQHPTPATQHAPLPPLTPLHKQRSRVSRLTASASVSTISPTDALEEHFMAVNSEQLCTGTTANVALKYEVGSNLIFYSRKLTWLHCTVGSFWRE